MEKGLPALINSASEAKEWLMVLKLLSEYPFEKTNALFTETLNKLEKNLPTMTDYLRPDIENPRDGYFIKPAGVQKILELFEEEFQYPVGVLSCQPASKLPELIEKILSSNKHGDVRGWATWNDQDEYDPHMVPVFSIAHHGVVHIFLVDSIGHVASDDKTQFSLSNSHSVLIDHFKEAASLKDRLKIYSHREKRQHGQNGCTTFSILDLKNMLEMHMTKEPKVAQNIVDFYDKQHGKRRPVNITNQLGVHLKTRMCGPDFYEVITLPPAMMKSTQSLKTIEKYQATVKDLNISGSPFVERMQHTGEMLIEQHDANDLQRKVVKNTLLDSKKNKVINFYAEKKRLTYMVYLLSAVMGVKDGTPFKTDGAFD